MNKKMLLGISSLLLFFSTLSTAGEKDTTSVQYIASNILQEEIVLFTDRSLYSINEYIYFSAKYITSKVLPPGKSWSTVLYLELIKPDGTALIQTKYPLSISGTSGYIHIPEEILSGVYYLKAYTKWMRNYPVSNYGYCQLILINPNSSGVIMVSEGKQENILSCKAFQVDKDIVLTTDKNKYGAREKVSVSFVSDQKHDTLGNYVISVVRKGLKSTTVLAAPIENRQAEQDTALFYPEIDGISISGKVLNTSGKVIENADVKLSLLNSQSFFSCYTTTSKGEFFFSFPALSSQHDFFIDAEKDDLNLKIELDKEFCDKPLFLKTTPLELSSEDNILAKEISFNAQLSNVYRDTDSIISIYPEKNVELSFYGTPEGVFYTKDYIDLPYLEEFIYEIIPGIQISNTKKSLYVKSNYKHSLNSYPFLVLIDNIPVADLSAFAKIRTNKVDRLEVIFNGYVIGNYKYSGVINALTKNKDLSGIDLPPSSMFFSYMMYANQEKINEFSSLPSNESNYRIPDRRNCLYWNPDYQPAKNSENHFTFSTSDIKGTYQVIVQAITEDGSKLIFAETEFVVE